MQDHIYATMTLAIHFEISRVSFIFEITQSGAESQNAAVNSDMEIAAVLNIIP